MPETPKAKRKRRARPLCHSAKISDYRFRKVRVYFTEVGLFTDIYEGQDPLAHNGNDPIFELGLIEYHFQRIKEKRGLKSLPGEPDYHLAESHWRYDFQVLMAQRPSELVYAMMMSHLLEIIRLCGPIGTKPVNQRAGLLAIMRQMDQRIAWLERNAPEFRPMELRSELRAIRAI